MNWLFIVVMAVIIDIIGEYPTIIHPVVWIGKMLQFFDKLRKKHRSLTEVIMGSITVIFIIVVFTVVLWGVTMVPNYWVVYFFDIYFLKSTFSVGSLARHVNRCTTENLEQLQHNVSYIVSRNTQTLNRSKLYSAAIESGAENIVDSVIAPLFYFLLFGIYGAMIYRIVNTADAMIGYKTDRYLYFGKFTAKFDDVLNFIPARILGVLLLVISYKKVLKNYKRYRKLKINGMYAIAGMAALLDVTLEKPGVYLVLGAKEPKSGDVKRVVKYIIFFSYLFIILVMVILYGCLPWWC